ncbi:hypothetical protein Tco_1018055 [Tanacetum coccineum]|uniref:Uncharacterized protein n=1 Tax=Tanacetum coccineum TaxID=301880 RepID=A0ABQ5FT90_9ASTR
MEFSKSGHKVQCNAAKIKSYDIYLYQRNYLPYHTDNRAGTTEPLEKSWENQERRQHSITHGRRRSLISTLKATVACTLDWVDGASWSTFVEEGEPIDTAGTRSTTLAIRAMTSGAGLSILGGGVSNSSNSG